MRARYPVSIFAASALALLLSSPAWATGGECGQGETGFCGTPNQSGGSAPCVCVENEPCECAGAAGVILVANTDVGDTYQYSDDFDTDGVEDNFDNCPYVANLGQNDSDSDGVGDLCDACPTAVDSNQIDSDGDGEGDACDTDRDNDGILNESDNCPLVPNPLQFDGDLDTLGDVCDKDDDDDGILDMVDNCPLVANPKQLNTDPNRFGDECDSDQDLDNIPDSKDNCPTVANEKQLDADDDGLGDLCDGDIDDDGIANTIDNCRLVPNAQQQNADRDDLGDACDPKFCYVVRRYDGSFDNKTCLDPTTTFKVFSPNEKIEVGEGFRLRLFANRQRRAMEYSWVVVNRPSGSTAVVQNSRGMVRMSSSYEYFYLKGQVPRFVPDEPGTYKIRLNAKLAFADTANPAWPTETSYVMTVTSEGDSAAGCSIGGTTAPPVGLLLCLGLLLLRRRD